MMDAGGVITSQVDLLWSVALALMLFEFYFIARLLDPAGTLAGGKPSILLAGGSIVLLLISMFFGYLTYGAIVTMARCSPNGDGAIAGWCTNEGVSQSSAFSSAELVAFIQFGAFGVGFVLFIILFAKEPKAVAAAFKKS